MLNCYYCKKKINIKLFYYALGENDFACQSCYGIDNKKRSRSKFWTLSDTIVIIEALKHVSRLLKKDGTDFKIVYRLIHEIRKKFNRLEESIYNAEITQSNLDKNKQNSTKNNVKVT